MAITECPHCRRKISDQAPSCPFCGGAADGRRIPVSGAWQSFAQAYSQLAPSGRRAEWEKLSEEQQQHFVAAWGALGHDAQQVPPPRVDSDTHPAIPGRPPSKCSRCGGTDFMSITEQPFKRLELLLWILGILLVLMIVGIFLIIVAMILRDQNQRWWICESCGARYPRGAKLPELREVYRAANPIVALECGSIAGFRQFEALQGSLGVRS